MTFWDQGIHMDMLKPKNSKSITFTYTIYSRDNIHQKCGGNCGLWVLHETIKNIYPENLKKIVGALWKLPAK